MASQTSETLKVGDFAPEFALKVANPAAAGGAETLTLNMLLRGGPAILEFLRGTW